MASRREQLRLLRLRGSPEQLARRFAEKQKTAVAALPPKQQAAVRTAGFATRPQFIRAGSALAKHFRSGSAATTAAIAIRSREGFKTTRTGVVVPPGEPLLSGLSRIRGAVGTELARHEVAHQALAPRGLTGKEEHVIIAATRPGRGPFKRLSRGPGTTAAKAARSRELARRLAARRFARLGGQPNR